MSLGLMEMSSQRGKTLLVLNNFKYREHHRTLSSGETKWRCFKKNCNAFLHTLGDSSNRIITNKNEHHNHDAEKENILERCKLTLATKRPAETDLAEKPAKIIRK